MPVSIERRDTKSILLHAKKGGQKMIPKKCPYYSTVKCPESTSQETEKEQQRYAKKNCYKKRYLNCECFSAQFFEDFFGSLSETEPERVRDFTKAVGAVVLEKIVKKLAKDELR
jgi:hypothetical protein